MTNKSTKHKYSNNFKSVGGGSGRHYLASTGARVKAVIGENVLAKKKIPVGVPYEGETFRKGLLRELPWQCPPSTLRSSKDRVRNGKSSTVSVLKRMKMPGSSVCTAFGHVSSTYTRSFRITGSSGVTHRHQLWSLPNRTNSSGRHGALDSYFAGLEFQRALCSSLTTISNARWCKKKQQQHKIPSPTQKKIFLSGQADPAHVMRPLLRPIVS